MWQSVKDTQVHGWTVEVVGPPATPKGKAGEEASEGWLETAPGVYVQPEACVYTPRLGKEFPCNDFPCYDFACLYDLDADPRETRNLINDAALAGVVAEMEVTARAIALAAVTPPGLRTRCPVDKRPPLTQPRRVLAGGLLQLRRRQPNELASVSSRTCSF